MQKKVLYKNNGVIGIKKELHKWLFYGNSWSSANTVILKTLKRDYKNACKLILRLLMKKI